MNSAATRTHEGLAIVTGAGWLTFYQVRVVGNKAHNTAPKSTIVRDRPQATVVLLSSTRSACLRNKNGAVCRIGEVRQASCSRTDNSRVIRENNPTRSSLAASRNNPHETCQAPFYCFCKYDTPALCFTYLTRKSTHFVLQSNGCVSVQCCL